MQSFEAGCILVMAGISTTCFLDCVWSSNCRTIWIGCLLNTLFTSKDSRQLRWNLIRTLFLLRNPLSNEISMSASKLIQTSSSRNETYKIRFSKSPSIQNNFDHNSVNWIHQSDRSQTKFVCLFCQTKFIAFQEPSRTAIHHAKLWHAKGVRSGPLECSVANPPALKALIQRRIIQSECATH